MGKRRTREELRQEYTELLAIWEHVRAFSLEQGKAEGIDVSDDLQTSASFLSQFDRGSQTPGALVKSMRALFNEMAVGFAGGLAHDEATARNFVSFYKASSGRDFFDDVGHPAKRLSAIMNRGQIKDEDEYFCLKEVLEDESDMWADIDRQSVSTMMSTFERSVEKRE